MTDRRHEFLLGILKRLPSDFQPWGQRSRDDEWGPDCSCGCRWYLPLEGDLRFDWGVCYNPRSPRCGLLTFEHQGCMEFEDQEGVIDEAGSAAGSGQNPSRSAAPAEVALHKNFRLHQEKLKALLEESSGHWGFADPVYRFYHQSFKVYGLQEQTKTIVNLLASLAPERPLNSWFLDIVQAGTGKKFRMEDNADWTDLTRPILEAFFHARFFLEMAVRYSDLDAPPNPLPSGYAALLYLYGLRVGRENRRPSHAPE